MRPHLHAAYARRLCLLLATTAVACATDDRLMSPTRPSSVPVANTITSVSPPVNITGTPVSEDFGMVSGNYVLWLDNSTAAPGILGDILACDVSSGLDACASGRVQAVNLTGGTGVLAKPSLGGGILVWVRGGDGSLVGCSLAAGLSQCNQAATVLRAGGLMPHPGTPFVTFPSDPAVNDHVLAWIEVETSLGKLYVYGCDIAGGLQNCAATTARLSADNQAPLSKPAVGSNHVFWDYKDYINNPGGYSDIAGCDFSQGLSECIQTATNVTNTSEVLEVSPVASGGTLAWGELAAGGITFNVGGCSVSRGTVVCSVPPVRLASGTPWALDGRVLVFAVGSLLINACDIGSGLEDCVSTTASVGFGRDAAVSAEGLVVWTWCKNCDQGGSGGDLEIFGARLTLSGPPPPPPTLIEIVLTPATASLATGATQQFSASGRWSDGTTTAPAVTYTASGGTITTGGLYTAGQIAGNYEVIATQQGGTLAGRASVTVTAAPPNPPVPAVTPTSLDFGAVEAGQTLDKVFTVRNTGGGSLTGDVTTSGVFSLVSGGALNLPAGQSQPVTIRFSPTAAITYTGVAALSTNAGTLQVDLVGTGAPPPPPPPLPPTLSLTPLDKLIFGSPGPGASQQRLLSIQNSGGGTLQVDLRLLLGGGGTFSLPITTHLALNGGETARIPITFTPARRGSYIAQLVVSSNAGAPRIVALAGGTAINKCLTRSSGNCDLVLKLRDPYYFGVPSELVTDDQLLALVQDRKDEIQAELEKLDYAYAAGAYIDRFPTSTLRGACAGSKKRDLLKCSERRYFERLSNAADWLDRLDNALALLDVFAEVGHSPAAVVIGTRVIGYSAQYAPEILAGLATYRLMLTTYTQFSVANIVLYYVGLRRPFDPAFGGRDAASAWADTDALFGPLLDQVARAAGVPRDALPGWLETKFEAISYVGYPDSELARWARGLGLAGEAAGIP